MKPVWLCSTCDKTWIHGKPDNHQHPLTPMYSRESLVSEIEALLSKIAINDPERYGLESLKASLMEEE